MALTFPEAQRPFFEKAVRITVKLRNSRHGNVGTGFVLSESGVILTAEHVVRGSKTVQVKRCWLDKKGWTVRDTGRYIADVIYTDKRADVAVLKLRRPPTTLIAAKLGDSDELEIGSPLFRVGSDEDKKRLSEGHLFRFGTVDRLPEFVVSMHTDDGSSGGPIFDQTGAVVGIMLRGDWDKKLPYTADAIPINVVKRRILRRRFVKDLLEALPSAQA